jgi:hypothetical protein
LSMQHRGADCALVHFTVPFSEERD